MFQCCSLETSHPQGSLLLTTILFQNIPSVNFSSVQTYCFLSGFLGADYKGLLDTFLGHKKQEDCYCQL